MNSRITITFGETSQLQRDSALHGFILAVIGPIEGLNDIADPEFAAASSIQINNRDKIENITRASNLTDFLLDTAKSFNEVTIAAQQYFGAKKVIVTGSQSLRCAW